MTRYDIDSLENRDPNALERFAAVLEPVLWNYFRPVVRGLERVPSGAALYVGNHSAGFLTPDTFIFGISLYKKLGLDEVPYGLAHEVALGLPVFHEILVPLGAVRASHRNAHRIFDTGRKVMVYPGGDYDSFRPFSERNKVVIGPRRGYIRLALRENVPIIPVVTVGSHATFVVIGHLERMRIALRLERLLRVKVWPLTLSLPWGVTLGPPPPFIPLPSRIFIEVLEPILFDRQGEEAADDEQYVEDCHQHVLRAIQDAMDRLAAERRRLGWRRWAPFLERRKAPTDPQRGVSRPLN